MYDCDHYILSNDLNQMKNNEGVKKLKYTCKTKEITCTPQNVVALNSEKIVNKKSNKRPISNNASF